MSVEVRINGWVGKKILMIVRRHVIQQKDVNILFMEKIKRKEDVIGKKQKAKNVKKAGKEMLTILLRLTSASADHVK